MLREHLHILFSNTSGSPIHTIMTFKFVMALNIPLFLILYSSNRKLNNINYKILRNVTVFIKLSKNPIFFESFFIINGFGLIYISCASQAVLSQHSNFLYYRNKCPRRNQQTWQVHKFVIESSKKKPTKRV